MSSLFYILTNTVYQVVPTCTVNAAEFEDTTRAWSRKYFILHVYHNNVAQLHNVKHHKEHLHTERTQNPRIVKVNKCCKKK